MEMNEEQYTELLVIMKKQIEQNKMLLLKLNGITEALDRIAYQIRALDPDVYYDR